MIEKNFVYLTEKENFWYLFIILCLLNILSLYIIHDIIITDPQYFTGGNQNSVTLYRNVSHVIYFIYPFYCFTKVFVITGLLSIGLKFFNLIEVEFKKLMSIVILAEIVFWIQDLAQIIWFLFIHKDYSMKEVDNFSFLSIKYFLNPDSSDFIKSLVHILSVPEILFCLTLILGIQALTKEKYNRIIKAVVFTYGIAILLYFVVKSYFQYKTFS